MTDASSPTPALPEPSEELSMEEYLARVPQGGMGALNEKLGIEFKEVSSRRLVATMPVEGNTQPYGLLHGGASVALAESLGSIGSGILAWPDRAPVGVDINATHHRALRPGSVVTGVATPVYVGRTMATFEVIITDERDKRVCTVRLTCALVPKTKVS